MKGQEKRGTPGEISTNPTQRGGRDSGIGGGQKGYGIPGEDSGNGTARGGRSLPTKAPSRGLTSAGEGVSGSSSVTRYDEISEIGEGY